MTALGLGPFWYSLVPRCWQWRCGADKIGYPRFHPMLLLGRAQTACSTCLELPSRCCLCFAADLRYAAAPSETFGLAGILWIAGIALLLCSAFFGSHSLRGVSSAPRLPRCWPTWEIALLAVAVRPGVAQSSLEPEKFPRQHLSGRNHDRHRRHSELSKSNNSAVGL